MTVSRNQAIIITVTIDGAASRLYGVCDQGAEWHQFAEDCLTEVGEGECVECGATINQGWQCLDGYEYACNDCVKVVRPDPADASLTTEDDGTQYADTYGIF